MNPCGECTVCCNGTLVGEAYGNQFGAGVSCHYLNGGCSIYQSRPQTCKNYFCAYAQDIIPGLKSPKDSGVLISVKDGTEGRQFLELVPARQDFDESQIKLAQDWAEKQGTYVIKLESPFNNIKCSKQPLSEEDPLGSFCVLFSKISQDKNLLRNIIGEFAKKATDFYEHNSVAKTFFKHKMYLEAIPNCEQALSLAPSYEHEILTRQNYVNLLNHANYPEIALRHNDLLIEQDPSNAHHHLEKAFSLFLLNRKQEAENVLRYAYENIELNYEQATKIRFNLGTYHLYRDDLHTGLQLFLEEGAKLKFWNVENIFNRRGLNEKYNINVQEWNGDTILGATILCYAEAGIGDEIINVRFMREIERRGMRAIWLNDLSTRNDLVQIFNQNGYKTCTSLDQLDTLENTYYAHGMTLPYKLKLEYPDLWHGAYLSGSNTFKQKWKEKIKTNKKLKVGIRWKGMPDYDQDLHRSVPLKQIYEQVKHLDAEFYSLQIDNYEEEIHDFPELVDLHDQLESWHDTFGLIDNLDFVITSCTSVAHAAASTGARVFVFVPISAYYTWSHSMKQSPWYGDNVTVLRQQRPRVWDEPCTELLVEMKRYCQNESLENVV